MGLGKTSAPMVASKKLKEVEGRRRGNAWTHKPLRWITRSTSLYVDLSGGKVIGYDLEKDRQRFTVTENGVVVIPKGIVIAG